MLQNSTIRVQQILFYFKPLGEIEASNTFMQALNLKQIVLEYVLALFVFTVLALCSHAVFLPQFIGDSFVAFTYVGGDATSQMIPAISLLESALLDGDIFWSWNYGLGGDTYAEFAYYYSTSPFFYVMFLIKCVFGAAGADFATTQAWRLIASILKQTLCMLFMYCLCRQEKRTFIFSVLSAVIYGCSFWFIDNSFAFDFMTDAMLWPPLIIMAYNRFTRTLRPFALVTSVALAVANSFYFGYMTILFLVLFALIFSLPIWEKNEEKILDGCDEVKVLCNSSERETFEDCAGKNIDQSRRTKATPVSKCGALKTYARRVGVLAFIAIAALALAAVAFLPSVKALLDADRIAQSVTTNIFPNIETLALLPEIFFSGYTPSSAMDLQTYAFPVALLLVPFICWRKATGDAKKKTILAALLMVLSVSPAVSSLFSGFSYPSNRWLYLVIFAVAYAFPVWMETLLRQKRIKAGSLIFAAIALLVGCATYTLRTDFSNEETGYLFPDLNFVLVIHLLLGCAFIAALVLVQFMQDKSGRTVAQKAVLTGAAALFCAATVLIMPFGPAAALQDAYTHPGAQSYGSYEQLNESFEGNTITQSTYSQLEPQDGEFYRILDGETTINRTYAGHEARVENRSWLYDTYGTSAYNSMISRSLNRTLKQDYAVTSTSLSASQYRGLGNRLFLENAWGVEYKFNTESDVNTPLYGYTQVQLDNGQTVWLNENACGIDLWYTSVYTHDQEEQLSYGQRDALFLQTAVLEGAQEVAEDCGIVLASDAMTSVPTYIDLSSLDVAFKNCTLEGSVQEGYLNAGSDSVIEVKLPTIEGAYLLSFKTKNPNLWGCSFYINGTEYYLSAADGRWNYDQDTFCISILGDAETLKIELPWGYFSIEDCSLEQVSYENLEEWTQTVNAVNLENLVVDGGHVSGNVLAPEAGILAINASYSSGWHCRIDGEEVNVLRVNDLFCGVAVTPGEHTIEFYYVNKTFIVGAIVSISTLVLLIVCGLALRVKKRHLCL